MLDLCWTELHWGIFPRFPFPVIVRHIVPSHPSPLDGTVGHLWPAYQGIQSYPYRENREIAAVTAVVGICNIA
jgi:hypothetical protein